MIKYIKRKDLNVEKYNFCVENAVQSRIYAFSWYLDIVCHHWDVLVLDDYKAVMPIPWKQKYLIKYIAQPPFCQQLGVFSIDAISDENQKEMIAEIPDKFLKVGLHFNSDNVCVSKMRERTNYVLELNENYFTLFKSFSKGRKHAAKTAVKNLLSLKECTILELIKTKKEFYTKINFSEERLEKLSNHIIKNNNGFLLGVFKNDLLLGGGLFLKSNNRITYLFSSFNEEGRQQQAASFLIASIIKQYESSTIILDFEGSNLPNIASFFKSFGAKTNNYHCLEYQNLPTVFNIFDK